MSFYPPHADKKELMDKLARFGFLTSQIKKALDYAERAHKDQKRDFGNSYLEEHIYPIALSILTHNESDPALEDILILGILHDVVEDDPQISRMDIEKDFGKETVSRLSLLTKKPQENISRLPEDEKTRINTKMLKILEHAPRSAQIVKLEDRLNNLSSFEKADTPKYIRYIKETKDLFIPFAEKTVPFYKNLLIKQLNRLTSVREVSF